MGKLCGTEQDASFWLNVEVCGLFCACTVYALLVYADYVVCFVVLDPWKEENSVVFKQQIIFTILIGLAIFTHLKAMCSDPGAVPEDAMPIEGDKEENKSPLSKANYRQCSKCDTFKPERTHHCSMCKRCIIKMDHHCPWLNNCVGIGNHKHFLLFLLYTFLSCFLALYFIIARVSFCTAHATRLRRGTPVPTNRSIDPHCDESSHADAVFMFTVAIEAVLFGLFTLCMMCDQSSVVFSAMTQIDRLKNAGKSNTSLKHNMMEVFGGDGRSFSFCEIICFFIPTSVVYKGELRERILGYRIDKVDGFGEDTDFEKFKNSLTPENEEAQNLIQSV